MALFWEGLAAFLEAVGIAAILWVLFDWFMYPKRAGNVPVLLSISGDAGELEHLLRRLDGLTVILRDEGLADEGLRRNCSFSPASLQNFFAGMQDSPRPFLLSVL